MTYAFTSRLGRFLLTVLFVVTGAFFCVYRLPGDPARMILGRQASDQTIERFREDAGLNDPVLTQYARFLKRSARLDFGESLAQHRLVAGLIRERLPFSLVLLCTASLIVIAMALILPILMYLSNQALGLEALERLSAVIGIVPPYVSGVLAVVVFAGWLTWLPAIFDSHRFESWLIAALVLAAYPSAVTFRIFSQELRQSLRSPYVLRARAMGLSRSHLILVEAVPNSFSGALGSLGNGVAIFMTGSLFVETIFGIPGIGSLTYQAVQNKDLPLLTALCIVFAIGISLLANTIDVLRLAFIVETSR
jgi:peptide/nickel transport system permease protein